MTQKTLFIAMMLIAASAYIDWARSLFKQKLASYSSRRRKSRMKQRCFQAAFTLAAAGQTDGNYGNLLHSLFGVKPAPAPQRRFAA